MKRRSLAILILLIAAVAAILFFSFRTTDLEDLIRHNLGTQEGFDILSIEKMEADQEPVVLAIDSNSDKEEILECIRNTKVRFKNYEVGMEINSALYTLRVSVDDEQLSITVNENNEIHLNQTETTYVIKSDNDLYQILKKVFGSRM